MITMRRMRFADKSKNVLDLADKIQRATIKSSIAGQAFTCKLCGETDTWANTSTPKICFKCAVEFAEFLDGALTLEEHRRFVESYERNKELMDRLSKV